MNLRRYAVVLAGVAVIIAADVADTIGSGNAHRVALNERFTNNLVPAISHVDKAAIVKQAKAAGQ